MKVSMLLTCLLTATSLVAADAPERNLNVVNVSGNASVGMKPDTVEMSFGVRTDGADVRQIVSTNNEKVSKILDTLKKLGVKPEELQTSNFSIRRRDYQGQNLGYEVTNSIRLKRKEALRAGDLIQAAIEAGANEANGPSFTIENEQIAMTRCLALAFDSAKMKATQLASLSSRKLGSVIAVSDGSSSPFQVINRSTFASGVVGGVLGGVEMEVGEHRVNCGVTVAFGLE